jgi:subtilase family serine protease
MRFYLSTDSVKSGDDLRIGSRSVTALAPAASSTKTATSLTVPLTTPLGSYSVIACADDPPKNVEISEANNCLAAEQPLQVGQPDLVISSVSPPPSQIQPGKKFSATAATTNQGTASSLSTKTRWYLSVDAAKDTSDVRLTGALSIAALAPGETVTAGRTVTVPTATPAGTYQVLVCADDTSTTVEIVESNNCTSAGKTVQVVAVP